MRDDSRVNDWSALKSYPVEGDSAEFELYMRERLYAVMWLENIDLAASGTARTARATVAVTVLEQGAVDWHDLRAWLSEGEEWLLENERGRSPL